MSTKIKRTDYLTSKPVSGSVICDKEFPIEVKKDYVEKNLNEFNDSTMSPCIKCSSI